MENGLIFTEKLPDGGKLTVSAEDWDLSYYFPGPDRRYNGTILKIPSSMIHQYVHAWTENWKKFVLLKKSNLGGNFSVGGTLGMDISSSKGVFLHTLAISTDEELERALRNLAYVESRAAELKAEIYQKLGLELISVETNLVNFSNFKAGMKLGISTNPAVIREVEKALELVRLKMKVPINSCRHTVSPWFGKQGAVEFMADIRKNGLDVFCEQASFTITWKGRF